MTTISDRIRQAMLERGFNTIDLQDRSGIHRGTLSKYISGKSEPKSKAIHQMAKALSVDEQWLMGFTDVQRVAKEPPKKIENAPVYSQLSCGTGLLVGEQPIDMVGIPAQMMFSGSPFANFAEGDSMEPGIHNGDLLIFQETPEVESGQIGSFSLNGEYYCKRFKKLPDGSCWLFSDNPKYDPIRIGPEDNFRTLGLYKLKMSKEQ